ncbi:hypothetical protein AOQ84DRAFT_412861 [Glonium stellatum]|uniref:Zn(2)-C6 fungal-type domain-containing protein n=1 Tax=Glonium stellatum TaxID=574774 RepID=A0A8E2EWQ3_9PEZI|nr:hypothetical protein AOQ84DRAFT_412861 [Glonium stellatum]
MPSIQKYCCITCTRRKIKCDKLSPCSSCSKSQSECVYRAPAPSQRHRKRPADEDLLSKISEYEDLLRKNNVEFQPLHNSWIPSPLEEKLLRDFPIEKLKRPGKDVEDEVIEIGSSFSIATSLLIPVRLSGAPQLLELHPEPKHIFKLWQAFAENVNPLTKVIHAPTLQQRILEISWNLENVTRPLEAVMFGVYALAITSIKPSDCIQAFGETRSVLLNRYRSGAAQALIAAKLHSTRDLEVLQAFVLFLLLDPRSELSLTVVATATRIGHKMGLHHTGTDARIPFFEQEMRLRVWWQIMSLESRARRKVLGLTSFLADYGDVRLPLNVNDASLHPAMAHLPASSSHPGATEMLFCLLKYEVLHYVRSHLASTPNLYDLVESASTSPAALARKRAVLTDLERIYETQYLCHCDPRIPLHHIAATVARLTIHRVRLWCAHPRYQPRDGALMSRADTDAVFESSVRLLQLHHEVRATRFSAHLLEHLLARTEVEALVFVVSDLRWRVSGELVRAAWGLVGRMYEGFPQLLQLRDEGGFYGALAELTLEAWEARGREVEVQGEGVPGFIGVLQGMRSVGPGDVPTAVVGGLVLDGGFQFELIHDDPLDWVYWNELSQL